MRIVRYNTFSEKGTNRIDDIQDNSILRRGSPVAHSVYGIASSLNAANYLLFIALERIVNLHPAATKVYMEQMLEVFRGQGIEIFWRDNLICPSEADYKTMAMKKAGGFFNLMVTLMKLFSTYKEDLSSLSIILGLHFQIRDDYGILNSDKYTENKGYCDDLSEGKFSFPIVHALTMNPDDKQIIYILKQLTKEIELKHHCVKLLEKFGSFEYTKNVLEDLDVKARAEIKRLGGNPIDDIQDNSILRRGSPVAHSVYGIASSLNAATYLVLIALERIVNLHPAYRKSKSYC
ncbi:geranylgeranyl pyrophosphate synthase-like [Formica exsecta]|uniref:geranylgeranyl pyrophosphate synthase-like n=1 Tax=Formica exsecta TaxID=72781 RepID=UPI0011426A8D|nr:geranylgeranyl pyrophosphate synthase-like [Formica exsecta]